MHFLQVCIQLILNNVYILPTLWGVLFVFKELGLFHLNLQFNKNSDYCPVYTIVYLFFPPTQDMFFNHQCVTTVIKETESVMSGTCCSCVEMYCSTHL